MKKLGNSTVGLEVTKGQSYNYVIKQQKEVYKLVRVKVYPS